VVPALAIVSNIRAQGGIRTSSTPISAGPSSLGAPTPAHRYLYSPHLIESWVSVAGGGGVGGMVSRVW
jgi:hypothetical protein